MILKNYTLTTRALVLCASSYCVFTSAEAQMLSFEATTDFPVLDAGDVPFYSEAPGRNSLAINAAKENFRNKFARATMVFEGPSAFFDITLSTLAELDGEARYRVLINDVLIGSATNPEVTVDYTPVRHTFEHIVVPEGATIAVESLANTNGKIAEGDGTAFARGRWTALEFSNDDAGTATEDHIDLSISVSTSPDASSDIVGDSHVLTFGISNAFDSAVATQPVLTLTRPRSEVGIDTDSLENCTESGNDIICNLSEIPAQGTEQLSTTLVVLEPSPSALLRATVSADQTDSDTSNNSITFPLRIVEHAEAVATPDPDSSNADAPDNGNGIGVDVVTNPLEMATGETSMENRSGGGASGPWSLIILAALGRRRLRRV